MPADTDHLLPGESLARGQRLLSSSGRYTLIFQDDGNLVLYRIYRNRGAKYLWDSATDGRGQRCVMQGDGLLVIYGAGEQALAVLPLNLSWPFIPMGVAGTRLVVQDDGNAVLYRPEGLPVWATNTVQQDPGGSRAQGDDMQPGEVLEPGDAITSPNGRYSLIFQGDGNLVLYRDGGTYLWDSATDVHAEVCVMQDDGNLVIYAASGQALWASGTHGNPGSRLVMQDDGNLVIYRPDGAPVWTPPIVLRSNISGPPGWVEVTLRQEGTVRFRGNLRNEEVESISFVIRAIVRGNGVAVAMAYRGHAGGWQIGSGDPRDESWDETYDHPGLSARFPDFRGVSQLSVEIVTRGDVTGPVGELGETAVSLLVPWAIGQLALLAWPGISMLILVGVAAGSVITTGGFEAGARLIAGKLWLAGPGGLLVALAAQGVAVLGDQHRVLSADEYQWADDAVFRGTLPPRDQIVLTDTAGPNDRPFVFPRFDGKITLNLGLNRYANPMAEAATLIHELVHAWQLHNTHTAMDFIGAGVSARVCELAEGQQAVYGPGAGTPPFSTFNIEQQASVVERWFNAPDDRKETHPYYGYIVGNIRTGLA